MAQINSFLQILTITIGTFMIERYVLLEQPMEPKRQRLFYAISFCSIIAAFFVVGEAAQFLALVFGGLNILLGRKKHRVLGFFMVIPLIGIINGAASPIFTVTVLLKMIFDVTGDSALVQMGMLGTYLIFAVLLLVFYFKGRGWRRWFGENMKDRSPSRSELILIFASGIVLTMFSSYSSGVSQHMENYPPETAKILGVMIIFFECMAFLATLTIIVLVMQGNRRKFYHDRVSGMQFNVIATMADIVENRDSNTGGHIKRTAKYVEIIGRSLLKRKAFTEILTEQYLSDMIVAAPLHDIGKICIPDAILNKPGKLTDEEFEIMKTHARAGRDVLKKAESKLGEFGYLEIAMDMAEYHHEKWNGTGYPEGISGEAIPLCARIMAVADVFDALTSKRCYKEAMPLEKAYGIIRSDSGTHFDPVVAQSFLDSTGEIELAMRELSDDSE